MRRKMPVAAAVAIVLALLLAMGAIAATVAGSMLRDRLNAGGAEDAAGRVRDVNIEQSEAGFGFAVEQCYWEGDVLCLSYRASVPEDGREYLLGLEEPTLNGTRMGYSTALFMDGELSGQLILLGGERMTSLSDVLELSVDDARVLEAGNAVALRANFMTPAREIRWVSRDDYHAMCRDGMYGEIIPEDGYLYAWYDTAMPTITLENYPAVEAIWAAQGIEPSYNGFVAVTDEYVARLEACGHLTAAQIEQAGLATLAQTFEVEIDVDGARYDERVYRGARERTLQFRNCRVEIEGFALSHLRCEMDLNVIPNEGVRLEDVPDSFVLYLPNGAPLLAESDGQEDGWMSWCWTRTRIDGSACYNLSMHSDGVLAVGAADRFLLVPRYFDPDLERYVPDMEDAALIIPTTARFEEDPDALWANTGGQYYHRDRYCSGMRGAQRVTIEEVEAAGKPPCPKCVR